MVQVFARKVLHWQLGENFTYVQPNIPRAQYLAEPVDSLRLIQNQHRLRMLHGTFSCRNRSMTRGGLWYARSITPWIRAPARGALSPSPSFSPSARNSGSAMVAANASRNAARRSRGMPG